MTPLDQRQPRKRNTAHLVFVASKRCCVCNSWPVEVAHIRMASAEHDKPITGMGQKPDDRWVVPLCPTCHRKQHSMSEYVYWFTHEDIDPFKIAMDLWNERTNGSKLMATVSKDIAEKIIAADGYYLDDPRVMRVIEYTDMGGKLAYALEYPGEVGKYYDTEFVRKPRVIWAAKQA